MEEKEKSEFQIALGSYRYVERNIAHFIKNYGDEPQFVVMDYCSGAMRDIENNVHQLDNERLLLGRILNENGKVSFFRLSNYEIQRIFQLSTVIKGLLEDPDSEEVRTFANERIKYKTMDGKQEECEPIDVDFVKKVLAADAEDRVYQPWVYSDQEIGRAHV